MFVGERVSLAPLDRSHAERTRAWMNEPELSWLLGRALPISDVQHENWFADLQQRTDCVFFAVLSKDGHLHIGNVWLWDIDVRHRKAELRIVIGEPSGRGSGQGCEAVRLACAFGFERLNLHKIFAYVIDINPRACRAFEKAGFHREGILKADRWVGDHYADVIVFGRLIPTPQLIAG